MKLNISFVLGQLPQGKDICHLKLKIYLKWYLLLFFCFNLINEHSSYRGAPRLRTDRRAQSAKRGFTGQNGRRVHRGYPAVNMPRGVNGQTSMDQNGLSNSPTDEEYKDNRYEVADMIISWKFLYGYIDWT